MHIDHLQLVSFGKFKGKDIDLKPGLNVLFGPNEAGKSTVQRFVLGMLYGASKFGLKSRKMREDFESLRPWGGGDFEGRMTLALDDGPRVRVERDFDSEVVNVRNDVTGKEIECEVDKRRETKFAHEMLGLSGPEFEGTVCIGQMRTAKIEDEGSKAVAEHMARALTGGEGDSAGNATAMLGRREAEIGSEKAPTRPYAQTMRRLAEVRQELKRTEDERRDNLERESRSRKLEEKLAQLKARDTELASQIQAAERAELLGIVDRVSGHVERAAERERELAETKQEAKPLASLGDVPKEDAYGFKKTLDAYKDRKSAEQKAAADKETREGEVADLEREIEELGIEGDPVAVHARVEDLEEGIRQLQMEIATRASTAPPPPSSALPVLLVATAVVILLAGVALGIGISLYAYAVAGLAVPLAGFAALTARSARLARERRSAHEVEIVAMRSGVEAKQSEFAALQEQHGCSGPGELKRKLGTAATKSQELRGKREVLRALGESVGEPAESILKSLVETLRAAAPCSERIARAVECGRFGEAEAEEYNSFYRAFVDVSNRIEQARSNVAEAWRLAAENARGLETLAADWAKTIREACGSRDLAQARAAVEAAQRSLKEGDTGPSEHSGRSASELRRERQDIQRGILASTGESEKLRGQIEEAYRDLDDPAKLAREKLEIEQKLAGFDLQLRAVARARDVIKRVAEEMHRDFAPRLAGRVEAIIASLTGGRYASVKIGEDLKLTTEAPETGKLVQVEELSAGTRDQFYFALRVGAALELASGGDRPPIICDESLVQYDDGRALACLKYLHGLGSEYQILLLTCHEREHKAALALGANVILL